MDVIFVKKLEKKEMRKSNFELLRILAILCIIVFHHFGNKTPNSFISIPSGFTKGSYYYDIVNNSTKSFSFKSLILDFCYGHFGDGCNLIFMLITGYFLFNKNVNLEKRVSSVKKILFISLFGGFVLTIINAVMVKWFVPFPGAPLYKPVFNFLSWFSGSNMWYFQVYGLFMLLILPILKHFESKIDRKTHKLIIGMLLAICFLDISKYLPILGISFRIIQFTLCYYIGGYISKYSVNFNLKKLIFALIFYIMLYIGYEYYWRMSMRKMFDPYAYSYISVMQPFICSIIFAVLVFLIFSKLDFKSRVINHISVAVPGIYVFHLNFISSAYVIANSFWWKDWSLGGYCKFIIINTLMLFIIGYLIDLIRRLIFYFLDKKKSIFMLTEETKKKTS